MKYLKSICRGLLIAAFWIGVWWFAAWRMGKPLLFPTPPAVWKALIALVQTKAFYQSTAASLWNVLAGILTAVCFAILLSVITSRVSLIRQAILPVMTVIKATPVASFIILAWIMMGAARVPGFITFLIVLPVVWTNLDVGFQKIDKQLLEITTVYRFSPWKTARLLVLPSLKPYFVSAFRTSLGLAWKAGIAAEIITMPKNTVGAMIGEAKLYIMTAEMFAWTLVVILLSLLIEALFSALLKRFAGYSAEQEDVS